MKKVAILQSNYIPWRGYFDFINSVDLFVFFDDVQYTRRDWRSRNKIKTAQGPIWLTVPVLFSQAEPTAVNQTRIDYSSNWRTKHLRSVEQSYSAAPFFKNYFDKYAECINRDADTISKLNQTLIRWICGELAITTELIDSQMLSPQGQKTDRLLDILSKVGATTYISGPAAKDYIENDKFKTKSIGLQYKTYVYKPYPQLYGEFEGSVTVLDLLFNCGPESRSFLSSETPNEVTC